MADSSPIPNNGSPNGPEVPSDPGQFVNLPDALPDALPPDVLRALDTVYSRTPEAPAGYDEQVIAAASQVMAAAGQATPASRQSSARLHRRIRVPVAAGLAASLALVVGAWVLLSTTGGLGGPTVTGGAPEARAAKDGTSLISKAAPREATAFGRGAGAGGALRKDATTKAPADAMSAADADGTGGSRELSSSDAKLRFGEPAAAGQQQSPTSAAAMSDAAAGQAGAQSFTEVLAAPTPVQTPAIDSVEAAKQQSPLSPQPPGLQTTKQSSGNAAGAAAPQESPPAAAPTARQAARPPAAGTGGGTTGAALPPPAKSGAPAKEKVETPAIDVVDAFRLAWIVNADATSAESLDKDPPKGQPWITSARRDIDSNGLVNQADVDALLRELVKVPPVAPVAIAIPATPGASHPSAAEVQFDVVLNTGQTPLAGYQIEITGQGKEIRVVSVGPGTSVAFSEAPKFDGVSLGLAMGYGDSRMVMNVDAPDKNAVQLKSGMTSPELEGSKTLRLAAVSLKPAEQLPRGQVTVARVGWRTADGAEPVMAIKLIAAVDAAGEHAKPTAKLERVVPILK